LKKIELFLKKIISGLLKLSIVGECIKRISNGYISFHGMQVFIGDKYISNEIVSALYFKFYESAEIRLLQKHLITSIPIIEVGASIGIVGTLCALKSNNPIYSIEANPKAIPFIEKNFALNGILDSVIINKAISYENSQFIEFGFGRTNLHGSLNKSDEKIKVETITLSELTDIYHISKYVLLADIEGAEVQILLNENTLNERCEQILIELHDTEYLGEKYSVEDIHKIILKRGYRCLERDGNCFAYLRDTD
jgi:FkbM family methyltransferase